MVQSMRTSGSRSRDQRYQLAVSAALKPGNIPPFAASGLPLLLGVTMTGRAGPEPFHGPGASGGVTGVTHDSRQAGPGDLYAALPGSRYHGARFCQQAVEAGAVAVLTDPDGKSLAWHSGVHGNPSSRLTMIGVTGTSGKTTTSYLLESGLRMAGHLTGLAGGVETRVAGDSWPSQLTTPEATDLQALLRA